MFPPTWLQRGLRAERQIPARDPSSRRVKRLGATPQCWSCRSAAQRDAQSPAARLPTERDAAARLPTEPREPSPRREERTQMPTSGCSIHTHPYFPHLKAFERRLTEYIACLQPATGRWRMILIVVSVCTATGAWNWLIDPETQKVSFFTSLWNHPFFTISCITLIGLFFAGIHKRVVAPSIIAARCRTVLAEYNMSCDDTGKLILKPRPHVQ
ncbi:PREDICTED: nuclear envelope phosphatase-regulatory subunit 1 [Tinamus guttatus]|uniref:nuclear envelope phosphatase-regulatory subunit 1 n=1 Tax=Tinamus guttatus TaxID=94827 RepID=UPI00052F33E7|nr:PREDICTED: nuclear envelope phosphatase-regulatory subunit 1 [Tinamus guttatus]